MASSTVQESVLMRRQNAGSPNGANIESGLNHGLANNRQERQQMRQRGAASRKIESVDFGISFPSSARSLRSATRTPRLRRSTSRQASKTPVRRSREPSLAARSPAPRNETIEAESPFDVGAQPSKRRRLSQATQTPQQDLDTSLLGLHFTRSSSRRKLGSKVFPIAEDEGAPDPNLLEHPERKSTPEQHAHSPLFVPETRSDKENNTPEDLVSAKDYTLPVDGIGSPSIIPNLDAGVSTSDHAGSAHDSLDVVVTGEENADTEISQQRTANTEDAEHIDANEELAEEGRRETSENAQVVAGDDFEQDSEETGAVRRRRRKKRKSELMTRRKKRTPGHNGSVLRGDRIPARDSERAHSSEPPQSSPGRRLASTVPNEVEGETPARNMDRSPKETDDEGDETYIQGSSPDPETPALRKKGPQVSRRRSASSDERPRSKSKKIKPTFPILTHRLTNISSLPTIHEDEDDGGQSDDERDAAASLKDDRPQPNAVDVLAQICRETIRNMMERLSQTDRSSERAALKNKRSALEAFGQDLDDELFEMSEAVENRIDLEARARKSKREKSALQAEWLEIRKERERIALKCDAVRRRHWTDEEEARQKWQLSESARRAELEMDRGHDVEDEGTGFLVRSVAQDVSSASEQGGLLERIKSFNAHLENMALFLERRAA